LKNLLNKTLSENSCSTWPSCYNWQ